MNPENNRLPKQRAPLFNNGLSGLEYFLLIGFIPLHVFVVPNLLTLVLGREMDETKLTFICYCISTIAMLAAGWRVLRKDYDVIFDHPFLTVMEILASYFAMMAMNIVVAMIFQSITPVSNPNNAGVVDMFGVHYGMTAAMSIFLAPIAEELMFRAGVFGLVSRYNRALGYFAGILVFSLYHVWSYALVDPKYFIYMIQYIPVSFLLCRMYERTHSIWTGIFFHMLVNSMALQAVEALKGLM